MSRGNKLDIELGHSIKKHRVLLCKTQTELGKTLNISGQQVNKYELGINRISAVNLYKISQWLNISINDLLGETFVTKCTNNQDKTSVNIMFEKNFKLIKDLNSIKSVRLKNCLEKFISELATLPIAK